MGSKVGHDPQDDRIATVGAYDRFNYGDLLFPLVLDSAASKLGLAPLSHFSVRAADMSDAAGFWCGSIGSQEFASMRGIVVGGGEVLGARWGEALISQMKSPWDLGALAINKVAGRALDGFAMRRAGGRARSPFLPQIDRRQRLSTNAIGASSLDRLPAEYRQSVVSTLQRASYVSVRDEVGLERLREVGIGATLAPDSVAVLADLRPPRLKQSESIVVQCSRSWLRRDGRSLVAFVREAARRFERVELLPIGLAGGHGDLEAMRAVERRVGLESVSVTSVSSIWDIADTISSSRVFVGTSLHGHISAMAYGVPSIALAGISKLEAYVNTWAQGDLPISEGAHLGSALERALTRDRSVLLENGQRLASLAARSTENTLSSVAISLHD